MISNLSSHSWKENKWAYPQAMREDISVVPSRLERVEEAREVTSGKKVGGMRDDQETERQERRGGQSRTHTHCWLSLNSFFVRIGRCLSLVKMSQNVWMVTEHCDGGDISVSWGPERFQLLVMTNSYQVMAQRLVSSPQHMEKRSCLEL